MRPDRQNAPDLDEVRAAVASVRPFLLGHAGDIELVGVAEGVVSVAFKGACEACPSIAMTFVGAVRSRLMQVPGVIEVRSDDIHAAPRALRRIAAALGAHPVSV